MNFKRIVICYVCLLFLFFCALVGKNEANTKYPFHTAVYMLQLRIFIPAFTYNYDDNDNDVPMVVIKLKNDDPKEK